MPYCLRLLQMDILPQKESRRKAMDILLVESGVAWMRTGTFRFARRRASARPRSSPKFGRVMMMPSISSACFLKRAAHFFASS